MFEQELLAKLVACEHNNEEDNIGNSDDDPIGNSHSKRTTLLAS